MTLPFCRDKNQQPTELELFCQQAQAQREKTRKEMKDDCKHAAVPPAAADGCTHPDGTGVCSGECDLFEKRYKFLKKGGIIDKSKCLPLGFFGKGTTGEQIVAGMIEAMKEEEAKKK